MPYSTFSTNDVVAVDLDDATHIEARYIMRNANFDTRKSFIEEIREKGGNERVTYAYDNNTYQLRCKARDLI